MNLTITQLPKTVVHTSVPRINQADPEIEAVKNCPYTHCAPVTVAQTLIGLAARVSKLQMLLPPTGSTSDKDYQSKLIEQLAADMGTSSDTSSPNAGTTPQQFIEGFHRFVGRRKFKLVDHEWKGWGAGEIDISLNSGPPTKLWIANGLAKDEQGVNEHIGWYVKGDDGLYIRKGGHFITAVGYEDLGTDNEVHLLQDPSPRSKQKVKRAKPIEIKSGTLNNGEKGSEVANGYLELDGIDVRPGDGRNTGVVDGAFIFGIERR